VSEIDQKLDYIIEMLENNDMNEPMSDDDSKIKLWLKTSSPKIVGFTYRIPEDSHIQFKLRCAEEGWSIQEGISRLIQAYIEDRVEIKQ